MPLRFAIRDLLWLTVVAALAAGWWLDRSRLADRYESLERSSSVTNLNELEAKYSAAKAKSHMLEIDLERLKTQAVKKSE